MRTKQMMLVTLSCMLLWMTTAVVASEHHDHSLKVGKKGEITLIEPTRIGDGWLLPNKYIVQHRTSGGDHFVRFVELKKAENWTTERNVTYTEPDPAGEFKCRMKPADAPIKETVVTIAHENGKGRITKVAIEGEDVVHIF